jgi:hypothetical protein
MQDKASQNIVIQEHPMGCAVACVAAQCGITYSQALRLFVKKEYAWTRGYYCQEVVAALSVASCSYFFEKFHLRRHKKFLSTPGTIIFLEPSALYPAGHYLLRTKKGWMNPWANFPNIVPAKAGIQRSLPGKVAYVIMRFSPP